MARAPVDLSEAAYGHWAVIGQREGERVLARCVCGLEKRVRVRALVSGESRSCGCRTRRGLARAKVDATQPLADVDAAWLAGLLEGEGCFTGKGGSLAIQLNMVDRDVLERVAKIVGAKRVRGPYRYSGRPTSQPYYSWTLYGESARAVMRRILPFMGARRSAKIRSLLA